MTVFKNIKELIKTLDWSKELLSEMFEKRNSFSYKHFGDFDFEGINIFLNEYKKHIDDNAKFFIPDDIEKMI